MMAVAAIAALSLSSCATMGTKAGMGDASINTAAKAAGIRKISHVDCQKSNLLGIFSSYKVVVYGE